MKLDLKTFLPKLALVKKVINPKPVITVQGCFLLRSKDGMLYVNASDTENTVSVGVKPLEYSEMNICVNANDFYSALLNLRGEEIELTLNPEKKLVRCAYKSGFFQLPYTDDENSSAVLEIQPSDYVIDKDIDDTFTLSEAIMKAEIATSEDNLKPILCGVHFDFRQDGMVVVACDSRKLSKYKTNITFDTDRKGFVMPKKGANILTSLMSEYESDTVNMKASDNRVLFTGEAYTLSVILTEGDFPSYDTLIPTDNVFCATVKRNAMLNAVQRVAPMESDNDEMLLINFDKNAMIIEAEDVFLKKKAKEKVPCLYDGEPMRIGMKSDNVITLLQALDSDDVEVHFKTPNTAIVILPLSEMKERLLTLCMPMIISYYNK